jgi:3-dehydroquinate synthetase
VVALGGGVVGDLGGFVAATVLRGVGLVQVPTSLLAMVDASVGGKTGINHRAGKNLIGAFFQPPVVVVDPGFLATMPRRSLTEGWAEVIKHAVIQRSTPGGERGDLLRFLERNTHRLLTLSEPATTYLIRRNVVLKAAVVEADERESGLRAFLNFGHTLGHAIEAVDYRYLHGEAVAVGMRAATRIALDLGLVGEADAHSLDRLIETYGLPTTVEVDPDVALGKIVSDKKRIAGSQRWVLPKTGGGVVLRDGVAEDTVRRALGAVRVQRSQV